MSSIIRTIKTLPFMVLGAMMATSSRTTNTKVGLGIVVVCMIFIWASSALSSNSGEDTTS
jgi:hypothetical protein